MARKVKGMTIELSADMTKFDKAMQRAYNKSRELNGKLQNLNKLLKYRPNDKDLYSQSFKALEEQIDNSKRKLKDLSDAYKIACKDFKDGKIGVEPLEALRLEMKDTENDIRKFQSQLDNLKKKATDYAETAGKINVLNKSLKENRDALDKVNKALKLDHSNVDLVKAKQALLNETIEKTEKKLELAKKAQKEALEEFNKGNMGKAEYAKVCAEVVKTKDELRKLIVETDTASKRLREISQKTGDIGKKMTDTGKWMTTRVSLPIAGALTAVVKENMALEDAMAGVHKTTSMTDAELKKMQETFIDMSKSTPVTAKELANIGEIAGQLGIKKENIAQFAKTISDLTIATNLTKEQGSMDLARFMAITQMSQDEVGNLGSAIVDLGNNYATNEDEIVSMSLRLAAQGKIAGLTEADIMGIATALSAVGLKSEQGGSSFSRIMAKMNSAVLSSEEKTQRLNQMLEGTGYNIEDVSRAVEQGGKAGKESLDTIGNAIGMTGDDLKDLATGAEASSQKLDVLGKVSGLGADGFAKAWREDPMIAIEAFIKGIKGMIDRNEDLTDVFESLDMNGIRETDTLQRLAGGNELLAKAVKTSNDAYKDNTALGKEVEIFNKTTSSQLKILKNDVIAVAMSLGNTLMPVFKNLVEKLKDFAERLQNIDPKYIELIVKALLGLMVVGPIVGILGNIFTGISKITGFASEVSAGMTLISNGFSAGGSMAGLFAKGLSLLLTPTGAVVAAMTILAGITLKNTIDWLRQASVESDIFGEGVSEGTARAVKGFLDLDTEATNHLNTIKATGEVVSQETVDAIAGNFEAMGEQIAEKINTRKEEASNSLRGLYTELGTITDEENLNTIARVELNYDEMARRNEEGQARIKEILTLAKDEKRTLSEEERNEIATIQAQMKDDGIRVLSESEEEYKIIRQRMKDQAGEISTEQASKLVEDSVKVRDETIANAEEEYNKRIIQAELLRADASEESAKLADKLLEDSKRARDKTIADAEERHRKIVEEAKNQAGEHVKEVDWETGQIKTDWEILKGDLKTTWDGIGTDVSNFKDNTKRAFSDLWGAVKTDFGNFIEDQREGFERIGRHARDNIDGYVESFRAMPDRISDAVIRAWNWVKQGVYDSILEPFESVIKHIKGMFDFELPMPRIPRPHIQWQEYSVLNRTFSIPWSIDWYKDGGIFTKPTLFNTPYGMKGVGEAGPEAVLPIEKLDNIVANAIIKAGGNSNDGISISGNTFYVREDDDVEKIARRLYDLIERKKRGVGLG